MILLLLPRKYRSSYKVTKERERERNDSTCVVCLTQCTHTRYTKTTGSRQRRARTRCCQAPSRWPWRRGPCCRLHEPAAMPLAGTQLCPGRKPRLAFAILPPVYYRKPMLKDNGCFVSSEAAPQGHAGDAPSTRPGWAPPGRARGPDGRGLCGEAERGAFLGARHPGLGATPARLNEVTSQAKR